MNHNTLNNELKGMDLSLLDQVLKGRFTPGAKVLDAGFGSGRNLFWFLNNGFDVFGNDRKETAVNALREKLSKEGKEVNNFVTAPLEELPWEDNSFDIIICNAVLHFAKNQDHFHKMFESLIRVLAPKGILFIRMTSDIGIADRINNVADGVFLLPDGSHRFLLSRELLASIINKHNLKFVEPLKTVNVNDVRCMSTLVLTK